MVARRIDWSEDMDAALIDAAFDGLGLRLIEERIGVSRDAIRRRRTELDLPPSARLGRPPGRIEWHERG